MASETIINSCSFRQCLSAVVAALCVEVGYDSTEELVLETLTEMLQSYICEISNTTRSYYEHSGRTVPTVKDVMCALADLGFQSKNLPQYINRPRRINLGQLSKTMDTITPAVLQVGKRKNFSSYVHNDYNFPHFPDPHAYIRTTTNQKPETDYVVLRERLSIQKRDVERALTRFVAKTGKSHPLLPNDKHAFPLIAAQPSPVPYLAALLPSEHETLRGDGTQEEGAHNKDEESKSKQKKAKKKKEDDLETTSSQEPHSSQSSSKTSDLSSPHTDQSSVNHNPYLRPVKKAKSKKKQ